MRCASKAKNRRLLCVLFLRLGPLSAGPSQTGRCAAVTPRRFPPTLAVLAYIRGARAALLRLSENVRALSFLGRTGGVPTSGTEGDAGDAHRTGFTARFRHPDDYRPRKRYVWGPSTLRLSRSIASAKTRTPATGESPPESFFVGACFQHLLWPRLEREFRRCPRGAKRLRAFQHQRAGSVGQVSNPVQN